ncbi:hypothetical protein AB0F07_39720 [Streptomyces fructofermentans]|uniref:hypothetical protein n=1 Tax=Streptomyces fructofermentans TaxID=152141 RepID=UPI0033E47C92
MVNRKNKSKAAGVVRNSGAAAAPDPYAERRRARFGALPTHVRLEDTVEERPAEPLDARRNDYDPDEWLVRNVF